VTCSNSYARRTLLEAVRKGFAKSEATAKGIAEVAVIRHRLATLAPEERQVLKYMIAGVPNKRIVAELQLSPRTVDRRRAAVLTKMQVESVPALAGLLSRVGDWE
jgi:two-component system response regulator FixJ